MTRRLKILLSLVSAAILVILVSPMPGFRKPLSTVVEARDGTLLGARIAADGQWRFPFSGVIPDKFKKSLLTFEDRWFYWHPGINPVSIARAFILNRRAGRIVSGGSTITMQVARLSRGQQERTYTGKVIEMLSALKLELLRSKRKILQMYVANAPFGGNTVGLEAATWRYFGKSPENITWAEAASLAVLPNSPSLVFPGRNQEILRDRRDQLLKKLMKRKFIDSLTFTLSLDEPLPGEPDPLPSLAPHLTDYYFLRKEGSRIRTTIDHTLQEKAVEIINRHQKTLASNLIFNSACLIVDVNSGEVLAYTGNSSLDYSAGHGENVDIIRSLRSTGSILKPILYAAMQQSGELLPNTLVADIPTRFQGFTPVNFDRSYSGAVKASMALSQSLNIPAVKMLQKYNPDRFLLLLRKTGFTTFDKPADHYGLSLILGGGETSLWELTGVYASLSRVLKRFNTEQRYIQADYHPPVLTTDEKAEYETSEIIAPPLSAAAIWLTYEALQKVNRPETESGWQYFSSAPRLAWKTGTSFGFRDAWAVGTTPDFVIGVWVGNADGTGRPGLTGLSAAAPILFELAACLPSDKWFSPPYSELTKVRVCRESGFRAGPYCINTEETDIFINGMRSEACPYHQIIHLDSTLTYRLNAECANPSSIINKEWFILPPAMEYYYRKKHPEYKPLPPFSPGCKADGEIPAMEFIYPSQDINIFIPRDQTGLLTRVIAEAAHRNPSKLIYWHLDRKYLGNTTIIHQQEFLAEPGNHILSIVDEDGNSIYCNFTITGENMDSDEN